MLFRKKIVTEEEPYDGRIRISADTRYKLYVNARLVEVGPSRGDHQVWFYDTVDILPYLKKGMNIIGVSVLRYPEDPASGNHGMFRTPVPGLYVTGKIEDMAGNEYEVSADASWKCMTDKNVTLYREEERFAPLIIHENTAGNPLVILYELPSITLGVCPAAPGYKKVRIAPVTGYLTNASGVVKTPAGNIRVSWKIENGAFKIDYEVPQNIEVVR